MQAHKLQDVLARVVAWHNRHPLARRIQAHQVHSVGQVRLPFAAQLAPPATPRPVPSATAAEAELADALAGIGADGPLEPQPEPGPGPSDGQAAERDGLTEPATADSAPDGAEDSPDEGPDNRQSDAPWSDPAVNQRSDTEAQTESDSTTDTATDAATDADADVELVAPAAEAAASPPPERTEDGAATELAGADPAAPPDLAAAHEPRPATEVHELAPGMANEQATAAEPEAPPLAPDAAEPGGLAARLQAARAVALGGDPAADRPPALVAADNGLTAPRPPPAGVTAARTSGPVLTGAKPWWQRGWQALRPWARRPAEQAAADDQAAWHPGRLTALFRDSFLWPIGPARVARWARQHGALAPLAPRDWPHRQVRTDAGALRAARSAGHPHTVQLHLLTAAIGVGDRRIRLLLDAQGQVLGPRAYDPRRLLAAAGGSVGLLALATTLHMALRPASADLVPVTQLAAASAWASAPAAALSRDGHGYAAASAPQGSAARPNPPDPAMAAAPATPDHGASAAQAAEREANTPAAPDQAVAAQAPPAPASTEPDQRSARLPPGVTSTPPPRVPERRASGPMGQVRPALSSEARLLARQQSEAARAATRGEAASASPSATVRAASPAAASAFTRYAVLGPASASRAEAEAQLAPMMSVRAQLPPPGPAFTELVQQNGRWRPALWPFATAADADRARSMMVTRGVQAEVLGF